jgi:hypothetical protein
VQKLTYFIVVLLFSSCSWRVFENGQYKGHTLAPPTRDSILTLSLSHATPLPDSAFIVSHIIIQAPWQTFVDYDRYVTDARNEAARLGGNVIKINQFHALIHTKWIRQAVYATVYRMDERGLVWFRQQLDSADGHYADSMRSMAVVHIRDRDISGKRVVYFDDSIVARIHGVGFDGLRRPGNMDLVFRGKGVLRVEPGSPAQLDIELGKEYFMLLYSSTSRHGYVYQYELMDKEHFYYPLR